MPFPSGPPPLDEFGAINQPRTLNRWLDVNPVHRLTRTREYLTIPAFSVTVNWLGYSDIIAAFNFEANKNFTLKSIDIPDSPNYIICIMWKESGITYRYKLWEDVGEIFFFDVPLYTGQLIKANFRFEIWSVIPTDNTTIILSGAGTSDTNTTYTKSNFQLWLSGLNILTYLSGTWTVYDTIAAINILYYVDNSNSTMPFGNWQIDTGIAPTPFAAISVNFLMASDLVIYTSVLGNQDYMWANDTSLQTTGAIITNFSDNLPSTLPITFPSDSSPTTN